MHNYFVHVIIDLVTLLGLLKGWNLHAANWLLTRSCHVHAGELRMVWINLPQKFTCIFQTACQNNFEFSVELGQALYFCVAQLLNWTGVQKKFPRRVCGGGPFWHRRTFAALELRLGKISSYKSAFTQFMRWSTCIAKTICIAKVQKEI